MAISGVIYIVLGAVAIWAGGMLALGIRGRRVGDDPHCRKCNYNLTGLTSERCPECAALVAGKSTVRGMRVRRRGMIVGGAAMLLITGIVTGGLLYTNARRIDWYKHYPVFLLRSKARGEDTKAIQELLDRTRKKTLQFPQLEPILTYALDQHGAEPAPANLRWWVDLLAETDNNDWLNSAQRDRLYRQMLDVNFLVRPTIRNGDKWHFVIDHPVSRRSTLHAARCMMREDGIVDSRGEWINRPFGGPGRPRWGPIGTLISYFPSIAHSIGKTQFRCTITQAVFSPTATPGRDEPVWSRTLELTADVTILPEDAPSPVELIADESLQGKLEQDIRVGRFSQTSAAQSAWRMPYELSISLRDKAPVCLAFDVYAVNEDVEVMVGQIAWEQGKSGSARFSSKQIEPGTPTDPTLPGGVYLELRPSTSAAAAHTLDCFEIWNGTITLGPVIVVRGS